MKKIIKNKNKKNDGVENPKWNFWPIQYYKAAILNISTR